jgi:hypothetical protein
MTGVALTLEVLLLSVLIFGSLGALLGLCMRRRLLLPSVVIGLTIVHEILFIGYPIWYALWSDFRLERELLTAVASDQLIMVMVGEALFCVLFALAFACFRLHGTSAVRLPGREQAAERMLLLLVLAGLVVYGQMVLTPPTPYEEMELIVRPEAGWVAQIAGWLNSLFHFTPLIAAALLVFRHRDRATLGWPIERLLSIALLLLVVYVGLFSGVRGRITWVISVLFVGAVLRGQRRGAALTAVLAAVAAPLVFALGPETRAAIIAVTSAGFSRSDIVRMVLEFSREGVSAISETGPADQLAMRAQGPRNAVALYRLHDEVGAPGPRVYLGSVLFPIPRRLWTQKLAPGSPTPDFYDAATYQSKTLSSGPEGEMGPVLASAHAYWEGGWMAVAFAGLLTGLFWGALLRWSGSLPPALAAVVVLAFAGSFLVDGFLTAFCPLWTYVLTAWRWIIPVFGIYGAVLLAGRIWPARAPSLVAEVGPA